ncbi:hypothetical protein HK104_004086, partial [Borealophlyctis nickersoniae]
TPRGYDDPNAPKNPILHFDIRLDSSSRDVQPGGTVKGTVILDLLHDLAECKMLAVKFEGLKYQVSAPYAPNQDTRATSEYHHRLFHRKKHTEKALSNHETFLVQENDVWKAPKAHSKLDEGHHEWEVEFKVPADAPPTGAQAHGSGGDGGMADLVLYRVHAIIQVGNNSLGNQEATVVVHVLPPVNATTGGHRIKGGAAGTSTANAAGTGTVAGPSGSAHAAHA